MEIHMAIGMDSTINELIFRVLTGDKIKKSINLQMLLAMLIRCGCDYYIIMKSISNIPLKYIVDDIDVFIGLARLQLYFPIWS